MNDPLVIKFSNEQVRPLMLALVKLNQQIEQVLAYYDAWGLDGKLAADTTLSDPLEDGAPLDGRPVITAGGLRLAIQNLRNFHSQLKSTDPRNPKQSISFLQGVYSMAPFIPRE